MFKVVLGCFCDAMGRINDSRCCFDGVSMCGDIASWAGIEPDRHIVNVFSWYYAVPVAGSLIVYLYIWVV